MDAFVFDIDGTLVNSDQADAELFVEAAGFPTDGITISTSNRFEGRVSIMRDALSTAPGSLGRITYFGDGVWDRSASRKSGWEFVPVGKSLGGIEDFYGAGV